MSNGPKPQRLTAQMEWRNIPGTEELTDVVTVRFGEVEVATMPPCRESKAGHGDDSTYFTSEEEADKALSRDTASIQRALSLAGAWKHIDDEGGPDMLDELDRMRHETKPTPPFEL